MAEWLRQWKPSASEWSYVCVTHMTSLSCRRQTGDAANVLQTKADAQCDKCDGRTKLATLSGGLTINRALGTNHTAGPEGL